MSIVQVLLHTSVRCVNGTGGKYTLIRTSIRASSTRRRKEEKTEFPVEQWFDYDSDEKPKKWLETNRWRVKPPKAGSVAQMARVAELDEMYRKTDEILDSLRKVKSYFRSTDQESFKELDQDELDKLLPGFEESKELQDAPDVLKKIHSMRFAPRKQQVKYRVEEALAQYQVHADDDESFEAKVATKTIRLRNLQLHAQQIRKDGQSKRALNNLIQRRDSDAGSLRDWNKEQYERVMCGLRVQPKVYDLPGTWKIKLKYLRKFAISRYLQLKKEKLEALQEKFKDERVVFQAEKERVLQLIKHEEAELGITEEDRERVLQPRKLRPGVDGMRHPPIKFLAP